MTYQEQLTGIKSDWKDELSLGNLNARAKNTTSDKIAGFGESLKGYTLSNLSQKAGDWHTCAVANTDVRIPRDHKGIPDDEVLARIAVDFYESVSKVVYAVRYGMQAEQIEQRRLRALSILAAVHKREQQLLNEL